MVLILPRDVATTLARFLRRALQAPRIRGDVDSLVPGNVGRARIVALYSNVRRPYAVLQRVHRPWWCPWLAQPVGLEFGGVIRDNVAVSVPSEPGQPAIVQTRPGVVTRVVGVGPCRGSVFQDLVLPTVRSRERFNA